MIFQFHSPERSVVNWTFWTHLNKQPFGNSFQSQVPDLHLVFKSFPTGKFSTAITKGSNELRKKKLRKRKAIAKEKKWGRFGKLQHQVLKESVQWSLKRLKNASWLAPKVKCRNF